MTGIDPQPRLTGVESVKRLALLLQQVLSVRKHDRPDDPQAWTLAHGLSGIEESCYAIVATHLPALVDDMMDPGSVDDILHALGEEFRHILYHIDDMAYYRYLKEP